MLKFLPKNWQSWIPLKIIETAIPEVKILEPTVHQDERGFFMETYQIKRYQQLLGEQAVFVQDNFSRSIQGVLRGLHYQKQNPQGKLVTVLQGEIYDVAVDIRPTSQNYKKWVGVILSAENHRQLWVPPGFAHGFLTLSAYADMHYKCTQFYAAHDDFSIQWNDPALGIQWPLHQGPLLSRKDEIAPCLSQQEYLQH